MAQINDYTALKYAFHTGQVCLNRRAGGNVLVKLLMQTQWAEHLLARHAFPPIPREGVRSLWREGSGGHIPLLFLGYGFLQKARIIF